MSTTIPALLLALASAVLAQPSPGTILFPSEPSGIIAVPGGLLIADDELLGSLLYFPLASLDQPGGARPYLVKAEMKGGSEKYLPLEDIEGLAADDAGTIYVVASHHARQGKRRHAREGLFKAVLHVEQSEEPDFELAISSPQNLRRDMLTVVIGALKELGFPTTLDEKEIAPTVNIEGIAVVGQSLWLGLREPLHNGRAILIETAFDAATGHAVTLDLEGASIRDLAPNGNGGLLLLSGGEKDESAIQPEIFDYTPGGQPTRVHTFTPEELRQGGAPEGITRLEDGRVVLAVEHESDRAGFLLVLSADALKP